MNSKEYKQIIEDNVNRNYHIITYGCQMNEHESEKIAAQCEAMGYLFTDKKEQADLLVFNTCCVRENAEKKIFGNVGAIKNLKAKNKNMLVVVCGCMTQQKQVAEKLYKTFPFVDIVIGTHNLQQLSFMIQERLQGKKRMLDVWEKETSPDESVSLRKEGVSAYVNIMYGCNNFCSYCIVPYVRGRERSRNVENILLDINQLVSGGVAEIMLLGQNVNSYGKDIGKTFAALLEEICQKTDVRRIRFMTSHPKDLSDELIAVIAKYKQICKHIHLPVQSGSSRILDLMNRKYTREDYLTLVKKLREAVPGIAITTDIIVGFPTETEEDFLETLSLVERVRFESAFTFVYSKRTGTAAATMEGQVDESTKKDRIMRLVALQNGITEEINRSYVGTVQRVLVEGMSTRSEKHVCGKADSSKMVNFDGNADMINQFYNIRITLGKRTTLFGKIDEDEKWRS